MSAQTVATLGAYALVLAAAGISARRNARSAEPVPPPMTRLLALEQTGFQPPAAAGCPQPAAAGTQPRSFRSCLAFGVPVLLLLALPLVTEDLPFGLRPGRP